ncbi:MAG TPA: GNVR domain-containing protein, partial [Oligoflexia bacterium]|nr:GNVR domain-containing protein [Oligoflexia bacterium]
MTVRTALGRYWRLAWAPALVVVALVFLIGVRLPDYFTADVLILAQPHKVKTEVVPLTEKEEQDLRLSVLLQELLARPRLRSIIEQFNLYPEYQGIVGKEFALRVFQQAIQVTPAVTPTGKPLENTFRVSFTYPNADRVYEVTQELSRVFLEDSFVSMRDETRGTEEFLDAQLREARRRLEETEALVQAFVQQNVGRLPEHREQALVRLQNAQSQLTTNSQMIATNTARIGYLQRELKLTMNERTLVGGGNEQNQAASPEESLAQLEGYLVVLRSRYSDSHPDVINTKKRIAGLKAKLGAESGESGKGGQPIAGSVETRQLRREIGELEAQTQALRHESDNLKKLIEQLNVDIKDMPLKEQELMKIRRDYTNVKDSYEKLLAAKEDAEIRSSLVKSQKSAQFKIVDPPQKPVTPAGPNRMLIGVVGIVVGLVIFALVPLGLFIFNGAYKFRDEVEKDLGVKVIGMIPPM